MATQQLNSTQIQNDIIDRALSELSGNELKVIVFVARQTNGWNKVWDFISASQMMQKTSIKSRNTAHKCAEKLESDGWLQSAYVCTKCGCIDVSVSITDEGALCQCPSCVSEEMPEKWYALNIDGLDIRQSLKDQIKLRDGSKINPPGSNNELDGSNNELDGSKIDPPPENPKVNKYSVPQRVGSKIDPTIEEDYLKESSNTDHGTYKEEIEKALNRACADPKQYNPKIFRVSNAEDLDDIDTIAPKISDIDKMITYAKSQMKHVNPRPMLRYIAQMARDNWQPETKTESKVPYHQIYVPPPEPELTNEQKAQSERCRQILREMTELNIPLSEIAKAMQEVPHAV